MSTKTDEELATRCARRKHPVVGWDVEYLFEKKIPGWTGSCDGTATVNGKCYEQGAINYFLWGKIGFFCVPYDSETGSYPASDYYIVEKVRKWKSFRGGDKLLIQQAIDFTKAGWSSCLDFKFDSDFKKCTPDNTPYKGDLGMVRWGERSGNPLGWWED